MSPRDGQPRTGAPTGGGFAARLAPMPPPPTSAGDRATVPSPAAILAGIAEVAREHVGWHGELSAGMRLVEDLRLDSLRLLTLAVEVENRFRVALDEEDEAGIESVGDLVAVVHRKLAADAEAG